MAKELKCEILETLITKGDSQMWGGHVVMPAETDSGEAE